MTIESAVAGRKTDAVITVRCNDPFGEDMLFGICKYNAKDNTLESLDGDCYSLKDEISRFELNENGKITVYRVVDWVSGGDLKSIGAG